MSGNRKKPLLKLGQVVRIKWVDSGMSGYGIPGRERLPLVFKETYGKISFLGYDLEIHELLCEKRRKKFTPKPGCLCSWLELTMCSAGKTDHRSELSALWIPSFVDVKVLDQEDPEDPS